MLIKIQTFPVRTGCHSQKSLGRESTGPSIPGALQSEGKVVPAVSAVDAAGGAPGCVSQVQLGQLQGLSRSPNVL